MSAVDDERRAEREKMVREQIEARGIRDTRVLDALRAVPRHCFVDPESAYTDGAQPIGEGQTISQPFIVALMTAALDLTGGERVLEIGAGSGYQTAILARLCAEVIAIERHAALGARARRTLDALGVTNVQLIVSDGSQGWPDEAPYDAILVAANAPQVPRALTEQLAPGGRLILPIGPEYGPQRLMLVHKNADGQTLNSRDLGEVAFVPLIGAAGFGLPADLGDMDF